MRSNIFRIFLSSTFGDFQAEREALREKVWPKIEQYCKAHDASFEVVDLRWGISEEDGKKHDALRICLDEIARCQQLSPKPNFLLLVGNRYGWRPLPSDIPADEFEAFLNALGDRRHRYKHCRRLLSSWYCRDDNAIPEHYRLMPNDSTHLKEQKWSKIESRLSKILRILANKLGLTPERRERYMLSATHLEIINGALKPDAAAEHVFGFFRDIPNLDDGLPRAKSFTDLLSNGLRDPEANELLRDLRKEIEGSIPKKHLHRASSKWCETSGGINDDHLNDFCNWVDSSLRGVIENKLREVNENSESRKESLQHHQFGEEKRRNVFIGREEELVDVGQWGKQAVAGQASSVRIVHGPGGVGKTAFMAKAIIELRSALPETAVVIERYIGTSPNSSNLYSFLADLLHAIASAYEKPKELPNGGLSDLIEELPIRMKWATAEKPLLLLLDAMDQFEDTFEARNYQWLPRTTDFPEHVALIISVVDGKIEKTAHDRFEDALSTRLEGLSHNNGEKLLQSLLSSGESCAPERRRSLSPKQQESVLHAFAKDGRRPLFLHLAAGIVRRWHRWDTPEDFPSSIEELVRFIVKNLSEHHGKAMTDRALGYLSASRFGFSDEEIRGLLWADKEALDEFEARRNKDQPKPESLPPVIWSRIYFELAPYMTCQSTDGALVNRFFHRIIGETVEKACLYQGNASVLHSRIASYFEKQPLMFGEGKDALPNLRKLMEEPWHWILAEKYDKAGSILENFDFVMAKLRANRFDDLLADFDRLTVSTQKAHQPISKELNILQDFMRRYAHVIRRATSEWSADRIFLQHAVEHADDSPITIAAERWLEDGKCNWMWFRKMDRPAVMRQDPCRTSFELGEYVSEAIVLNNKCIFFLANDGTLYRWSDFYSKSPISLKGHADRVSGIKPINDNSLISWSKDGTICLWNILSEQPKVTMTGHTEAIWGVEILEDGRILSWSQDKTIRLWDATSDQPNLTMTGHTKEIRGVKVLEDGRILSWSHDKTIRLWDGKSQRSVATLKGHSDAVQHAEILDDGSILSYSTDRTLRIWSGAIDSQVGTSDPIWSGQVVNDKMIITWSRDKRVDVWDGRSSDAVDTKHVLPVENPFAGDPLFFAELDGGELDWRDGESEFKPSDSSELWIRADKARVLANGIIMSFFSGRSSCVWGTKSEAPLFFDKGMEFGDTTVCDDGHRISLTFTPFELYFWDARRGRSPTVVPRNGVKGAKFTNKSHIFFWDDNALYIWSGLDNDPPKMVIKENSIHDVNKVCNGYIAYHSAGKELRIWNGIPEDSPITIMNEVESCNWLDTGDVSSFCASNQFFFCWNGSDAAPLQINTNEHTEKIRGALAIDSLHVLTWSSDRTLRIWKSQSDTLGAAEEYPSKNVIQATVLDETRIFYSSADNALRVWSGKRGDLPSVIMENTKIVGWTHGRSDGEIIFWSDGALYYWGGNIEDHPQYFTKCSENIRDAKSLNDGRYIFTSENHRYIWSGNPKDLSLVEFENASNHYCLSDGRILFVFSDSLAVWSGEQNDPPQKIIKCSRDDGEVEVWPLKDGRVILTIRDRNKNKVVLYVWNGNIGDPPQTLMESCMLWIIERLKDDRFVFSSIDEFGDCRKWIWSANTGSLLQTINESTLLDLNDGRVIFQSDDDIWQVWDCHAGTLPQVIIGVMGRVYDVTVLNDGRVIFRSDGDILQIWGGEPNEVPLRVKGRIESIRCVKRLSNGRLLVWSDNQSLRLIDGIRGDILQINHNLRTSKKSCKVAKFPLYSLILTGIEDYYGQVDYNLFVRPTPYQNKTSVWVNDIPEDVVICGVMNNLMIVFSNEQYHFLQLMNGASPVGFNPVGFNISKPTLLL